VKTLPKFQLNLKNYGKGGLSKSERLHKHNHVLIIQTYQNENVEQKGALLVSIFHVVETIYTIITPSGLYYKSKFHFTHLLRSCIFCLDFMYNSITIPKMAF
jgi:hypothetical protein